MKGDRESIIHHKVVADKEERRNGNQSGVKEVCMRIVVRASLVYFGTNLDSTACSASGTWGTRACRGHEEQRQEPSHRG